jgi:hypothetical protein
MFRQPVVEVVGCVDAPFFADVSYFLVFFRAFFFFVEQNLQRAFHVVAELPALVVNVTFHWHIIKK